MRVFRTLTAMVIAVAVIAGRAAAQATNPDSGRFRLHKFAQPIGERADLIVVEGNPLQRIEDLRNVRLVVSAGRRYDPAPLWRSVGFMP